MQIDFRFSCPPVDIASVARSAEESGFDGAWYSEIAHDPFMLMAAGAGVTRQLQMGTGVAVAFARNPMSTAIAANDLQALTGGRAIIGLGSQVKAHVTRRYSMPWSDPAARMREFVLAIRAIWESWRTGSPLDFRGKYYQHTLMTPEFAPEIGSGGPPPLFVAAVGPMMTSVAGEVADGLMCHGFTTARYLSEVTIPALRVGARKAGRDPDCIAVSGLPFVITGETDAEVATAAHQVRRRVAFYASTPAYRSVLELHGWGDLQPILHDLARQGRWDEMTELIDDDILAEFAVSAEPSQLGAELRRRFNGVLTRVTPYAPYPMAQDLWPVVVDDFRRAGSSTAAGAANDPEPRPRLVGGEHLDARIARVSTSLNFENSDDVLNRCAASLVDWIGVATAGTATPLAAILGGIVEDTGSGIHGAVVSSRVFGTAHLAEPLWACRMNGTIGHAIDYDDTHIGSFVHVSSAILPALLGATAYQDADGRAFLEAFGVGIWVCELLGNGLALVREGMHPSATTGAIAAAAATGRFLGLSPAQNRVALGLVGATCYGTLASFGTMAKPLQVGAAATNGLVAALLARRGITSGAWTAEEPVNTGPVLKSLTRGRDDYFSRQETRPGSTDEQLRRAVFQVAHKPYPSCLVTHPAIAAALQLRTENASLQNLERVVVRAGKEAVATAGHRRPRTADEAKFSLTYCVARALTRGDVSLAAFDESSLMDLDVVQILEVTELEQHQGLKDLAVSIEISLGDGARREVTMTSAPGHPDAPLTDEDIDRKFRENVGARTSGAGTDRALSTLWAIVEQKSMRAAVNNLWADLGMSNGLDVSTGGT